MIKVWLTKYGVGDKYKEMVVVAEDEKKATKIAFDLAKEELAGMINLEELEDIHYVLKSNFIKDEHLFNILQDILLTEIKKYINFEAILIKNEYTINLNSLFDIDKQYEHFIRTLIKANGCKDIYKYPYIDDRKKYWIEDEIYSKNLYIIQGYFSDGEIEMLKKSGFYIKNN
ncbi:hypothetical protein BFS06_14470 [Clostridium perfringens]|uniref:Uncharacterized protein n=1 Tax=Clostridium perfringens TaxID=1502 RepID=A0A140GRB5_CLOPF|nr:hypothetical protein [Clostridium perfringens]AMN31074.1 hypothetical protein JFP838_pA0158 [Clostridium perfringens]TBX14410.1 hypothetical protein BFS06_14470 [Clostridium perfringens]